jgi:hypothetical protein
MPPYNVFCKPRLVSVAERVIDSIVHSRREGGPTSGRLKKGMPRDSPRRDPSRRDKRKQDGRMI